MKDHTRPAPWQSRIRWKYTASAPAAVAKSAPRMFTDKETGITWEVSTIDAPPWLVQRAELDAVRALCGFLKVDSAQAINWRMPAALELDPGAPLPPAPPHAPGDPAFLVTEVAKEEERRAKVADLARIEAKTSIRMQELPPGMLRLPPLPPTVSGASQNPDKKALMARRHLQFGGLLYALEIWDSPDKPPGKARKHSGKAARVGDDDGTSEVRWDTMIRLPVQICPSLVSSSSFRADWTPVAEALRAGREQTLLPMRSSSSLYLFEYAEASPLIQNSAGDGSALVNMGWVHGPPASADADQNLGVSVTLDMDEYCPLLAAPEHGAAKFLFLHNIDMNCPVFLSKQSSALFVIAPESGQLRRVHRAFVCGQVEPRVPVACPTKFSKTETKFLKPYLTYTFLWDLYRSPGLAIPIGEVYARFPAVPTSVLDTYIRTVAESSDRTSWRPIGFGLGKSPQALRLDVRKQIREIFRIGGARTNHWRSLELGARALQSTGICRLLKSFVKPNPAEDVHELIAAYEVHVRVRKLSMSAFRALHGGAGWAGEKPYLKRYNTQLRAMKFVVNELMLAPWYLSYCFEKLFREIELDSNCFPAGTVMQVAGFGDPSAGLQEMISYQPSHKYVPKKHQPRDGDDDDDDDAETGKKQKVAAMLKAAEGDDDDDDDEDEEEEEQGGKKTKKRKLEQLVLTKKKRGVVDGGPAKPQIGGTENDLRVLGKPELDSILLALGIPESEVVKIERWDRTWIVKQVASHPKGRYLLGGAIAKYDRNEEPMIRLRHCIESSPWFKQMRQACVGTYYRMRESVAHANLGKGPRRRSQTSSSSSAPPTLDDAIDESLAEKKYAEELKDKVKGMAKLQEINDRIALETRDLQEWLQSLKPSATPRKILQRVIISTSPTGSSQETVVVQFHHRHVEQAQ